MGRKLRAGSLNGSIFALITWILGGGTISLPYLSAVNGIILAVSMIIFVALVSYFWGMLLVKCAEIVGSDKYEDFARFCYGNKAMNIVGWCNIVTMDSFAVSYIVFIKNINTTSSWTYNGSR